MNEPDDVVLPDDPDDDQLDDDELDEDELCEADADDFVSGELLKRETLRSILPFLSVKTLDAVDEDEAKAFARMRRAAADRATRILRSDLDEGRPA